MCACNRLMLFVLYNIHFWAVTVAPCTHTPRSHAAPTVNIFLRISCGQVMLNAAQTVFYTSQNNGPVLAVVMTSLVRKFQTPLVSRCVNEYGGNS